MGLRILSYALFSQDNLEFFFVFEDIFSTTLQAQGNWFQCWWDNYGGQRGKSCVGNNNRFACSVSEHVWESWIPHLGMVLCRRIGFRAGSSGARYPSNDPVSQFLTSIVYNRIANPLKVIEQNLTDIRFCNFMCSVPELHSELPHCLPAFLFPFFTPIWEWKPDSYLAQSCGGPLHGIFLFSFFPSHILCLCFPSLFSNRMNFLHLLEHNMLL